MRIIIISHRHGPALFAIVLVELVQLFDDARERKAGVGDVALKEEADAGMSCRRRFLADDTLAAVVHGVVASGNEAEAVGQATFLVPVGVYSGVEEHVAKFSDVPVMFTGSASAAGTAPAVYAQVAYGPIRICKWKKGDEGEEGDKSCRKSEAHGGYCGVAAKRRVRT